MEGQASPPHQQVLSTATDGGASSNKLPMPPPLSKVTHLVTNEAHALDNGGSPTIEEFMDEIISLHSTYEPSSTPLWNTIVIAGEGEPTLRWSALLSLANEISKQNEKNTSQKKKQPCYYCNSLRVTTNGLITEKNAAQQMKHAGIDAVSVALMTANPNQYQQLMEPYCLRMDSSDNHPAATAHELMCEFVKSAVLAGLEVEVTGVDHASFVDKDETERLAASLGVTTPMRWRPYFP